MVQVDGNDDSLLEYFDPDASAIDSVDAGDAVESDLSVWFLKGSELVASDEVRVIKKKEGSRIATTPRG